ncbi:molybdate ABC transporter ATP-binding protein ModF [Orbaceae bacterium ac157xtp]
MISINNAVYKINDDTTFNIENLVINKGECWTFIGRNGSGKSTLANILAEKQSCLAGQIENRFKCVELLSFEVLQKMLDDEWKRNNTDMLSEGEDDSGLTTFELIQTEIKHAEKCKSLAELFGIEHLLDRRFKYLSTGETRKALLCRSLLTEPDLLILDEPFDGLDAQSRSQLANLLYKLTLQGITLVLILNRFNELPDFVQFLGVISDCKVVKVGERQVLLQDEVIKQLTHFESFSPHNLPAPDEPPTILNESIPRVILRHGCVSFNDKLIIDDLTWQVNANEHWQIVGPNGAGKSTLLSLITGDHPQGYSNDLTLFGRRRGSGETIWDIKKHIGYVSSSFHASYRVNSSVKHVLISGYFDSIGVYSATSDKQVKLALEWLELLNMTELADKPFQSLSWGKQRLILIARALVKHPTLLILDEPLQGLDELNRVLIKSWIDLLIKSGNTQLLFVSHHVEDAPTCITNRLTFKQSTHGGYCYEMTTV